MKELWLSEEMEKCKLETLYIMGNGFDIAHGIDTRYSDFKKWLETSNQYRLVGLMDIFFSNKRDVWGDIEKALGEYDEDAIIDYCRPDHEFDYDHPTRSVAAIEDSPDFIFKPILDEFKEAFKDWVDSIDLTGKKRLLDLPQDCRCLTFNYTETLESVYGISPSNVLHIHGSRLLNDEYIVGHNNVRDENAPYDDDNELYFMQDTQSKIIKWMNELRKDTNAIINSHTAFFNALTSIQQIIVYGHSFYEVDWPYFSEIAKNTSNNVVWQISYHTKKDCERVYSFLAASKIKASLFEF